MQADIELIIVDDHSSDSTPDVLRELRKRYPENIRLILEEKNRG